MNYSKLRNPISAVNIERGVMLEAMSVAEFSKGGWFPNYKTKASVKKYIQKVFGSNDKANFIRENIILS